MIYGNVLKNSWWNFQKLCLYFARQFKEEVGSAEEQPTSNKIDAYTENEDSLKLSFFNTFSGMPYG